MKHHFKGIRIAVLACICLFTAGCSSTTKQEETASQTSSESAGHDALMEKYSDAINKIAVANRSMALIKKYGSVNTEVDIQGGDGTTEHISALMDSERLLSTYSTDKGNEYVYIDIKSKDISYYNEQEDTGSKFVFVDDSDNEFENYLDQVSMSTTYDEDEEEEIIDASEETAEDGTKLIHLTTKYDDPNIVKTLYESFSYPSDEYTRIGHYYTLRAESYEILKASLYFAKDDGKEQVAFKIEITAGTKEPEIPDALYEKTLKGDQRTLTLTVDPGTDHSRIITETVTKGSSFEVFDTDALYKDEACTKRLEDDTDKNSDVKLYCKSGS